MQVAKHIGSYEVGPLCFLNDIYHIKLSNLRYYICSSPFTIKKIKQSEYTVENVTKHQKPTKSSQSLVRQVQTCQLSSLPQQSQIFKHSLQKCHISQ